MARYSDNLTDGRTLRPLGGALVYVFIDDLTQAGGALASLTDDDGAPLPNPLTADPAGKFYFNAVDGLYVLRYVVNGSVQRSDYRVAVGGGMIEQYMPTGANAVARSYRGKVGERPSVFDYTGANMTARLSNAIAATQARGGGDLFIPQGIYLLDPFTIPDGPLVNLVGEGESTILRSNYATGDLLTVSAWYSTVSSIRFDSAVTRTGGAFVVLAGAHTRASRTHLSGDYIGVKMSGVGAKVDRNVFSNGANGARRIWATGGDTSQTIENNLMNAQSAGVAAGIFVDDSGALKVLNNDIIGQGRCLKLAPGDGQAIYSLKSSGNFYDSAEIGISLQPTGTGAIRRFRSECDWGSSHTLHGIAMGTSGSAVIDGVDIVGSETHNSLLDGIAMAGATSGAITNIRIRNPLSRGNAGSGLSASNVTKLTVTDPRFEAADGLLANGYGVFFGAGVDNYEIINGNATGQTTTAVAGHAASSTKVITNLKGYDGSLIVLPTNTIAPVVSGTAQDGQTLSVTNGTWTGSPTSYAYQWFSNTTNSNSGGTAISGATAATLLLVSGLVGLYIYCRITATNASGSVAVNSNTSGPVIAAVSDTTPDAFTFTDATGVALGSAQTSNTITVAGLGSGVSAPVTITGGSYRKNGGALAATSTTAVNGDTFSVSHTASASNSTATNTTLTVGGVSDTFTSTTIAAAATLDTSITPPDFTFTSVSTYPPELNFLLDETTVLDQDNLVIQYASDRAFTSPTSATVPLTTANITGTSPIYTASALASITSPAQTYLRARIERGTTSYSNWSTVRKHGDTTAPAITTSSSGTFVEQTAISDSWSTTEYVTVSFSGTDAALVESSPTGGTSGTIRLLANALPDYPTRASYSFNAVFTDDAGNATTIAKTWTISSLDRTPAAFTFTDVSGASPSTLYTSNLITVTSVDAGVTLPVTMTGGGEYQKNGGTWTTAGSTTAVLNDTFKRRGTSGLYSTVSSLGLNINGVSDSFDIAVMADPTGVGFTPSTTQPGDVNSGGVASFSTTMNFGVGTAYVYHFAATGTASGTTTCTIGGTTATLVAGNANGNYSVFAAAVGTAGNKTVTFTAGANVFGISVILGGTAVGNQLTPSSTTNNAVAFTTPPYTGTALTVLSQGLGVFFVFDNPQDGTLSGMTQVASGGSGKIGTSTTSTTPGVSAGTGGNHGIIGLALQK